MILLKYSFNINITAPAIIKTQRVIMISIIIRVWAIRHLSDVLRPKNVWLGKVKYFKAESKVQTSQRSVSDLLPPELISPVLI